MAEDKEYDALIANTKELLKTRQGQDFVWYILSLCNVYGESFTGNSQTFYLEGKRAVGLAIIGLLGEVSPTAYAELLLDKNKKENRR